MICASPSASFWSVLLSCILSAARACRASRQVTSSPRPRSSCTSLGTVGPISSPTRASSPTCPPTARSIRSWSAAYWPRHTLRPVSSRTQITISFCETFKPINRVQAAFHAAEHRARAPGSRHYGSFRFPIAITRCPHMQQAGSAYRRASRDRGGGRCPRAQPHAGTRAPDLRPPRLAPSGAGAMRPPDPSATLARLPAAMSIPEILSGSSRLSDAPPRRARRLQCSARTRRCAIPAASDPLYRMRSG